VKDIDGDNTVGKSGGEQEHAVGNAEPAAPQSTPAGAMSPPQQRGRFEVRSVDEKDSGGESNPTPAAEQNSNGVSLQPQPSPRESLDGRDGRSSSQDTASGERRGRFAVKNIDGDKDLSASRGRSSSRPPLDKKEAARQHGVQNCPHLDLDPASPPLNIEQLERSPNVRENAEPTEWRGRFTVKNVDAEKSMHTSMSVPEFASVADRDALNCSIVSYDEPDSTKSDGKLHSHCLDVNLQELPRMVRSNSMELKHMKELNVAVDSKPVASHSPLTEVSPAVSDAAVMQIQHMAAEMMQTMMQKMTDMSSEQKLNNGLLNQLMQRGCDTTPPVIPAAATQDTAVNATLDTLQSQIKQLQNEMRELKDKNKELTLANERHIEQSRRCQCNSRQG